MFMSRFFGALASGHRKLGGDNTGKNPLVQLTWTLKKMTDEVCEDPSVYGKLHQQTANRTEAPADPRNVDSPLASPRCGQKYCAGQAPLESSSPSYYNINRTHDKFELIEQQLQNLLNKADEFQAHLVYRHDHLLKEGLELVVPTFLRSCQPYFTYLESTARSSMPQRAPLPAYIRTRLLDFSQQLSSRLEQLVLMYASFNFLSLEETDPLSVSHFYVGQCQMDRTTVSAFRYCRPAPFGPRSGRGLYKRMRWNVERQRERPGGERERDPEERAERGGGEGSTEYYFLCYEDVPEQESEGEAEREGERGPGTQCCASRSWSIGQWIQTDPDPEEEDIYDWVLCSAPLGQYKLLLCLGKEEPSVCHATDCLLGALLLQEGQGNGAVTT
ncbi:hypothetical protein ANANG_G00030860 [Anguilla anguilla]|uniref:Uncharacterized protein n=1 Tax=Anguilla anguilla TaxID=7936 RepID=A0A9D3S3Y4_ANGAN|nr:hypothetical protein ANANG_G00030860 [Anguilla anguilla]